MKTSKTKKVLIALDYDPSAQKVAENGYVMANAMQAEITLLHIISDPVYYSTTAYSPIMGLVGEMESFQNQLDNIEGIKKVSQHFLDKIKLHLKDETIQTLLVEGDFAESILSTAKHLHSDVIVLGSHSRKWLEDVVLGSVTSKVLRETTIPLFIVPTRKKG